MLCSRVYLSIKLGSPERQLLGFTEHQLVLSKMVEESLFFFFFLQSLGTLVNISLLCLLLCFHLWVRITALGRKYKLVFNLQRARVA